MRNGKNWSPSELLKVLIYVLAAFILISGASFGFRVHKAITDPYITLPPEIPTPTPIIIDGNTTTPPTAPSVTNTPEPTPTWYLRTATPVPMKTAEPYIEPTSSATTVPTATVAPTETSTAAPIKTATNAPTKTPTKAPTATPRPATLGPDSSVTATPAPQGNYVYDSDVVNILLVGVDTMAERDIDKYGYQSDALILITVNQRTKKVSCISIPRDTYCLIDKLKQDGVYKTFNGQRWDRINAAYSQGGGARKQSYQNAMRAVSRLFNGIPINFYLGTNMDGLPAMVDALGGVEMTIQNDFTYFDVTMVKGKTMVLTGEQVMYYVRQRHSIPDCKTADIGRTERQRQFLIALAKQAKSYGTVELAQKMYKPFLSYIDTNLTLEQTLSLASILKNVNISDIETTIIKGGMSNSYYMPDQDFIDTYVLNKCFKKAS